MRTSLNEIKEIEAYLNDTLTARQRLVFEARMIISRTLSRNVMFQKKVNAIVQYHFRNGLKEKFNSFHDQLFEQPSNAAFKAQVMELFKR